MTTVQRNTTTSRSRAIREALGRPIVDCDGHILEFPPLMLEFLREVAGPEVVERYQNADLLKRYVGLERVGTTLEERRHDWRIYDAWWAGSGITIDRATVMIPQLLEDRMGDMGFDFSILYPSLNANYLKMSDAELRQAGCRAHNTMVAELFRDHSHVMTPVAVIPMHTPEEATTELDHAVGELGLKVVMLGAYFPRRIPKYANEYPEVGDLISHIDLFGIDSDYDYDPVWAKCQELGVAPSFHSNDIGWGGRRSISSYVYNHVGAFAAGADALCKALFLGGVTRRFPDLNFAFLEGGVAWACSLYADLLAHWEKRGAGSIERLDPARIDLDEIVRLIGLLGEKRQRELLLPIEQYLRRPLPRPSRLDEFAAAEITMREDFLDLFVAPFYFGCEADTPLNAWAFNEKVNPLGAKLHAFFGSDIAHWDVPDVLEVVEEAYELVEHGLIGEDDFKAFTLDNPVRLHGEMNREFFEGTSVETEAEKILANRA
jgi:predicted TIM-barrel fold metal-dependent hydrolase